MTETPSQFAKQLLTEQSTGPCVMLAYCWANAVTREAKTYKKGSFSYQMPAMNERSRAEAVPYYAVLKTNRSGETIYTLPGGGQDLLFFKRGILQAVELSKPSMQADYLRSVLGVAVPDRLDDQAFIEALYVQDDITDLTIESKFNAAAREAEEEHGWSYAANRNKIVGDVATFEHEALLKRSFDFTPPRPVSQAVSLVEVSNFADTLPWHTDKTESKAKGRHGVRFFEQGDFMCLEDLQEDLEILRSNLTKGNVTGRIFDEQIVSTSGRVDMVAQIERTHIYPKREAALRA